VSARGQTRSRRRLLASLAALLLICAAPAAEALGRAPFVALDQPGSTGVALLEDGRTAPIHVDAEDDAGVRRAATDLQADIERVGGARLELRTGSTPQGADLVLIGTLGKSPLIDRLADEGKIDGAAIRGKWEGFLLQTIEHPLPGVARALVIAGSDRRGTIYGIYELSEQIGVSPWYWWADVPPSRHTRITVPDGTHVADAPVVRYRGIFLNDEAPALTGWVKQRYGGYNHRFYAKVFELILRLHGNMLWPAMWNSAFFDDDKLNGKLANEYGIVMGTSHHEPMMRAQQEWHRYGSGPWDYTSNGKALREFWAQGLKNTHDYDKLITIGMRGDGDKPMSTAADTALLERIVADQRRIIGREFGRDPSEVPQVWALYKEVQEYYEKGMRVPDDVLLLWSDDNWGNLRRLPTPQERKRRGGAGIYYHFDYVGGPRSYKWLNVTPIPKIWEQMHLAWRYGADRLWIANVGDLKPMEVPIEFFMTYAWNPAAWPAARLPDYLKLWATREFGRAHADDIADIVARYTQYNGRRKPELLAPDTYSALNYGEAERIVADYNALAERALRIAQQLPAARRDAFFELVLYPVRACAVVNELYATVQLNRMYVAQGRASANDMAAKARALFQLDAELVRQYHQDLAGGKWNQMMSQPHIGYTGWHDPPANVMPEVREIALPDGAGMGVAVEGMANAWPNGAPLRLPAIDPFSKARPFIDVFNRGRRPFAYAARADAPWIVLSRDAGTIDKEQRIFVDVRWDQVPPEATSGHIVIDGPDGARASVEVPLERPRVAAGRPTGFVETGGVIAIEAEHYARALAPPGRAWLRIPGHGRTLSSMTMSPVDAASASVADGMRLEYDVYLFNAGKVKVHATLAPTQKFRPGPGFRYAVSFDDEAPKIVNMHADSSPRHWEKSVSDGIVELVSEHDIVRPGKHTLKFWALDPGIVLERMVIDAGGLKPSYLGPPESPKLPPG
jgi:hypothetical protein